MTHWSWHCDNDDEALGVRMLLERAGIDFVYRHRSAGGASFTASDADAEAAAQLESKLVEHYVRAVACDREARLDRRQYTANVALLVVVGLVLGAIVLAWM